MAKKRRKIPYTQKREAPPDAVSLEAAIRSIHAGLLRRGEHIKQTSHDLEARMGFQILFEQRAEFFGKLMVAEPQRATALMAELGLHWSAAE